VKEEAEVSSP